MSNSSTKEKLQVSKQEFLEMSYELGHEYGLKELRFCTDYGQLTLASKGQGMISPDDETWQEVTSSESVEDFGGVPDWDSFCEGFTDGLKEKAKEILDSLD